MAVARRFILTYASLAKNDMSIKCCILSELGIQKLKLNVSGDCGEKAIYNKSVCLLMPSLLAALMASVTLVNVPNGTEQSCCA